MAIGSFMKLIWSVNALADLERFAAFLQDHHPGLAKRIAPQIIKRGRMIADYPEVGRVADDGGNYRELSLSVLNATYVFRYSIRPDHIRILRVFHGREHRGS
jgi:plasmid stabilization system protein ParE